VPTLAITLGVTVVPPGWDRAIGVLFALVVGLAVLLSRRRAIGQTTLAGAWWWSVAALAAWSGVELAAAAFGPSIRGALIDSLRLAAMALSFCPIVAVVGAKRPQHGAWNFVVFSLWAVVALPAAEAIFLRGHRLNVGAAWSWFLWILILLGPINFAATRYWLASWLVAAGQVIALSSQLAVVRRRLLPESELAGLVLCVAGVVVAWLASRRVTAAANSYDRVWLDFRDTFGMLWGLRVQERINAAARQHDWDLELTWGGFRNHTSNAPLAAIDKAVEPMLRTTFKGLLRRFVSNRWISERVSGGPDIRA
jgi:hypothetical protein